MKIATVIATPKTEEEYKNTQPYKCLQEIVNYFNLKNKDDKCIIHVESENKTGLSIVYQNYLNSTDANYVLFIHDDVEIHDLFVFDKLKKAHEKYDIVGLAGSISQDYSHIVTARGEELPLVWHLRKMKPEHSRGIVSHFIPKGVMNSDVTHINSSYFGPTPSEVVVIDGLFMSFNMDKLKNKDEVFDRDFTFHHYDMGMCTRAKAMSLSIGVWPIYVLHYGIGEYANDRTWHKMAEIFKNKYLNYKNIIQ